MPQETTPLPVVWRSSATEADYEEARVGRVFNHRRPERFPLGIIEVTSEQQIIEAVKLALKRKCRISVRAGGHSWAVWSVRDNAILLDFGKYHDIQFDERTGIAAVTPSTTGQILNGFLLTKGLMFAAGHCPDVGLGGFCLQGGMGWNCRNWGWACEQLVALDMVTAEGKLIHADSEKNSDLLWAARGAGPGFPGVVTRFYLRTRPAPKVMCASTYTYPISKYKAAFDWIIKITPDYDNETEIGAISTYLPPYNKLCFQVILVTFKDSKNAAETALRLAEETCPEGFLDHDFCRETSLEDQYTYQMETNRRGHRYVADNAYVSNTEDVSGVLEKAFTTLPTPESYTLWYAMYPCSRRNLPDMALSMQSDHYCGVYAIWKDEENDRKCKDWVFNVMKEVERHSEGSYLGDSDFQVRRTKFWGQEQGKKLMSIRRQWDPEGRICGYLDQGDASGAKGLDNVREWATTN